MNADYECTYCMEHRDEPCVVLNSWKLPVHCPLGFKQGRFEVVRMRLPKEDESDER